MEEIYHKPSFNAHHDLVSYVLGHNDYDAFDDVLFDVSSENPHRSISRWEAGECVLDVIRELEKRESATGDAICVHIFNHVLYPLLFLGVLGAGCRFTGSNPAYTVAELTHHLRTSKASVIITEKAHETVARQAATECGISPFNVVVLDTGTRVLNGERRERTKHRFSGYLPWSSTSVFWRTLDEETAKITPAILCSTSGTTGFPKMAVRTHHALIAEHQALADSAPKDYEVRRLLPSPFFHAFTSPLALIDALKSGAKTYIMRRFDMDAFLTAVATHSITEATLPPPVLVRLHSMPEERRAALKQMRLIWTGGAPLGAEAQNEMVKMFHPKARIVQVWGMTEGGWFTTFPYPECDDTGSVGRFIPGLEGKVIGEDGKEAARGQRGEIAVRGPGIMTGYLGNEGATAEIFDADGFMRTGDVGSISEDGKVYILDRKKELIKVRGWQVAPQELETRLLAHEHIVDAAVIGIPLPEEASEMPCAYVVCTHPWATHPAKIHEMQKEIKMYLLKYLAKYKVGDCQIRFVEAIPKNPTGKILKKVLRKLAEDEIATDSSNNGVSGYFDCMISYIRYGIYCLWNPFGEGKL
ncbi:acetyl-CoA synthetase-like protein [Viridothelium virens]|uniref:Acetyl-CoA synthetase-like protein n=1 Tax=Viridothelium virens TaxID=1048519 RepID=A0A6A6H0A9_VIRVR|nr:acetyl-CoA synthetase-like protein [Viridothelium virens]